MVFDDFPFWLRFAHFINIIFIVLLIRSGIEILSALPKLYWNEHARPGTEWLKFTRKKVPKDRLWISLEEEESFPSWIALPGRKNLGLGRHWHFFSIIFWILNGAAYYILLFSSNEWQRLVPTSWDIIPQAIDNILMYASFQTPPDGNPYNAIQQLTYFIVVFFLGPFMIATGAAMSPSVTARFPWYSKIFRGRQTARSLHFLGMVFFIVFIIIHLIMVTTERFPENMGNMFLGKPTSFGIAAGLFVLVILSVVIVNVWATGFSLKRPRQVQNILGGLTDGLKGIIFRNIKSSGQRLERSEVSQFFRINGFPPETDEFRSLSKDNFVNYNLEVFGLVENPLKLSLLELRDMQKQQQVTEHFCIQGWTAIGEWGGVSLRYIMELCKPSQSARYVVFWSYQYNNNQIFYEVLDIKTLRDPQTMLAYEMNGEPLNVEHSAPIRLRAETQLGYRWSNG